MSNFNLENGILKLKYFALLFLLLQLFTQLRSQPSIDSMYHSISNLDDSLQIKTLVELCWDYHSKNPKLAIQYGKLALMKVRDFPESKYYSRTLNFLGVIYGNIGQLDSAFSYYNRAIQKSILNQDSSQLAYSYNNLGDYFYKIALFSIALENVFKAYDIFEKLDDRRGMAYALNDIGEIYLRQKDYEKALVNFLKAGEVRLEREDYRGYAKSLLNQAEVYTAKGMNELALKTYNKALGYSKKCGYIKGESWIYSGISNIYKNQKEYDIALSYSFKALEIDLQILNKYGELINYNQIGEIYLLLNENEKAREFLIKAINEGRKTGHRDQLMLTYDLLKKLSIFSNNYKDAYVFLDRYKSISDSIFSQENANKIADLQTSFSLEKKEKENELLKKDIEYEKTTRNYLVLISVLILGLVILMIFRYRSIRKTNNKLNNLNHQLEQANIQKEKMFSIIGHDLKNPAGSIQNFLEVLNDDYEELTEKERRESIRFAYKASSRLISLLLDLLEWGKVSRGLVEIKQDYYSVKEILTEVVELQKTVAEQKNISIEISDSQYSVFTDKNMIETVLRNLVSNGIKFTPKGGKISIDFKEEKSKVKFLISDTGVGIDKSKINDLFRIDKVTTTVGTENESGSGLGLPLASEFVAKCGGKIFVESEIGKGTTFIVELPK